MQSSITTHRRQKLSTFSCRTLCKITLAIALTILSGAWVLQAQESAKEAPTKGEKSSAQSYKAGTLNVRLSQWPKLLNTHHTPDGYTAYVASFIQASLLGTDPKDYELIPYLAESWETSKDNKTFTFNLNPRATFPSQKTVTAEDVKFTFDLIYDTKRCIKCERHRINLGKMKSIEVISPTKISITMKNLHFMNLRNIGTLPILEKAVFGKGDFNKDFNKEIQGAGPYILDKKESIERKKFVLKLRENFWANTDPYYQQRHNFKKIVFKYIEDSSVSFEAFKRKEIDLFYFDRDSFPLWDNTKDSIYSNKDVKRLEYASPLPYQFVHITFNTKKSPGKDLEFRQAIAHLVNRDLMISKVFNQHYRTIGGPFMAPSPYSANLPPTPYDPKKAGALLKAIGYNKVGDDGVLYRQNKDGSKERAAFTIIHSKPAYEPWVTILIEDAKKVGVEIKQRRFEWSSFVENLTSRNFTATSFEWVAGPIPLPQMLWHSSGANSEGSSNFSGFADPEADKLMAEAVATFDDKKRHAIFQKLEKIIVDSHHILFLWAGKSHKMVYWKDRVDTTSTPTFTYSGDDMQGAFYHWRRPVTPKK